VRAVRAARTPSDAELIVMARRGDGDAFAELRARHEAAAGRLARLLHGSSLDGDELVDRAFVQVRDAIERGTGPDVGLRVTVLATLRRLAGPADAANAWPTMTPRPELARAYRSLPEPWRVVLWYTDIEAVPAADAAAHLGVGIRDLAALSYRARARLRHAYLAARRDLLTSDACRLAHDRIEAHLLGALSGGETVRVARHLDGCDRCRRAASDLSHLRGSLAEAVAPAVIGRLWPEYLASGSDPHVEPAPSGRERRGWGRAAVTAAAVTLVLAGLLTWIVYGASTANISGAEVAADAQARGEVGPVADGEHDPPGMTAGSGEAPSVAENTAAPAAAQADPTTPSGAGGGSDGPPEDASSGEPAPSTDSASSDPASQASTDPAAPVAASPATPATPAPSTPAPTPAATPAPPVTPPSVMATVPSGAPSADLALSVSGTQHRSIGVNVVVTNVGPQAAAAPTVEFFLRRLPRGMPGGCSIDSGRLTMTCSLGTLAAGRHAHLTVSVGDGADVAGVRVTSTTVDPVPANNLWTLLPGLSLDRSLTGAN
jgi:DNA-directed RNA polymerase specialized sigma24 family protein